MATDGATSSLMDFEMTKRETIPISEKIQLFLETNPDFSDLMNSLAANESVFYTNQQRDEADLTREEKLGHLCAIFEKSKSNFLARFGQFLNNEQVDLFRSFANDSTDGYEVLFHLNKISRMRSTQRRHKCLRNRRYAALKRLISNNSYFSEIEMMKRNPLLYEQLIGKYLSAQERKVRDHQSGEKTFVGVLMDGIEKEQTELKKQQQVEAEDAVSESEDSDSEDDDDALIPSEQKPIRILWGEMTSDVPKRATKITKQESLAITSQERNLLREEFVSSMYQSFLDGKDDEFDYNDVDNNDEYDNLEIITHDEEEKYFDSEEPEDAHDDDVASKVKEESSEDELDIYMSALNQHPTVSHLSDSFKKL